MATRYFRVPPMVNMAEADEDGANAPELGRPAAVTRNHTYEPDDNGLIAVADKDDAEAFSREAGYVEVIGASELPAPPPTARRSAASATGSRTAGGASKGGK